MLEDACSLLQDYIALYIVGVCALNKPCGNNGTCIDFENDYMCRCKSGYEGKNCDRGNYRYVPFARSRLID